jgi:hypothetical protein
MRLVRLLIWVATLFFAAMLLAPLLREVISRASSAG